MSADINNMSDMDILDNVFNLDSVIYNSDDAEAVNEATENRDKLYQEIERRGYRDFEVFINKVTRNY